MQMNTIELEDGWAKILPTIDNLVHNLWPEDGQSWEPVKINNEIYMKVFIQVYTLCNRDQNYSDQLYQRYKDKVEKVFTQNVQPQIDSASDAELSMVVKDQWFRFRIFIKWISSFFSYLDRFHTKRKGLPSLKETGYGVFKEHLRQRLPEDIIATLEEDTTKIISPSRKN